MKRLLCVLALVMFCGCEERLSDDDAKAAKSFFEEQKVAREVLANGLIELTERVMVLEKRAGIVSTTKKAKK